MLFYVIAGFALGLMVQNFITITVIQKSETKGRALLQPNTKEDKP